MQHVLRAISGPHAGAVYVLGSRTTLGRASDCDIQIVHEGVSRHHAKLTLEDDGTVVIADLSSDNGTFVEDERIERRVLVAGEVIRVMRSRFAYEVLPSHETRTSAVFHRKVTSGDSLRQTVHHERSLAAVRVGVAQGLPGGMTRDRSQPYSRPQAAAPALYGARPGAATAGPAGDGSGAAGEPIDETPRVRRPMPPPDVDVSASQREPRPRVVAAEARAPHGRMVSQAARSPVRTEAGGGAGAGAGADASRAGDGEPARVGVPRAGARDGEPRPSKIEAVRAAVAGKGSLARRSARVRRDRRFVAPSSIASSGGSSTRAERGMGSSTPSGPSGRMAPLAPSGSEPEVDPRAPQAPTSGRGTGPMGSGWIRMPRPLDAPGSMRPGATLTGMPRIDVDTSPPTPSRSRTPTPAPAPSSGDRSAKQAITAEYGSVGERQTTERAVVPPPPQRVPPASAVPPASFDSAVDGDADTENDLDVMKTLPALRRAARRGSATPTEEVPRVRDDAAPSRAGAPPAAVAVPRAAAPPLAAAPSPELAKRLTTVGGSRTRARTTLAYEDTLRFQRPESRASASEPTAAPPDVPQPRPHATSAELISALEALLPPDEVALVAAPSEERPDAQTHAPGPDTGAGMDAILDAAAGDPAWSTDIAGLSEVDKVELRAQQVLEHAEREHKRREGLERLVDILEYRALRLRALRSQRDDATAAARCTALEQILQPRAPADGDTVAMRRYHRFVCSIPAQLTHRPSDASSTATVEIEDLSAGGARITFGEYSIGAGETVWLTVDLAHADRSRLPSPEASTVVIKARVVWAQPHEAKLGLVFAGAPDYK